MPQVGKIEYPAANITLPIKFTDKTGLFSCTYAGTVYQDTQIQTLREKVAAAIKSTYAGLDWIPVIELRLPSQAGGRGAPHFSLTKERKYIAHNPDLGYKQAHWTSPAEFRLPNSHLFPWRAEEAFTVPTSRESGGECFIYLPYSEVTWAEIEEIETYLRLASQKLRKGLSRPEQISATLTTCRMLFDHYATQEKTDEESGGE